MDMNRHWVWHAGGTRAPSMEKRGAALSGIGQERAADVVPQRATAGASGTTKHLVGRRSEPSGAPNGTQWHDGPGESIQGREGAR